MLRAPDTIFADGNAEQKIQANPLGPQRQVKKGKGAKL